MTRLLVCGGRNYTDYWTVYEVLNGFHKSRPVTFLFEGGALGADRFARRWARDHDVTVGNYKEMGLPDYVIAFPGGEGTARVVEWAQRVRLPVTMIE